MGFELRASHLVGRHPTTLATPAALKLNKCLHFVLQHFSILNMMKFTFTKWD
jgi:hypothetical protein